jgi:hypothetical protein
VKSNIREAGKNSNLSWSSSALWLVLDIAILDCVLEDSEIRFKIPMGMGPEDVDDIVFDSSKAGDWSMI